MVLFNYKIKKQERLWRQEKMQKKFHPRQK